MIMIISIITVNVTISTIERIDIRIVSIIIITAISKGPGDSTEFDVEARTSTKNRYDIGTWTSWVRV